MLLIVQKLFVTGSLKVDGGRDNNSVSEFDGPVVFTNKLTSSSDIEANSFFVQGNEEVSRKYSILNTIPTISGNYGDIFFNSEPSKYEFVGWTYVTENQWETIWLDWVSRCWNCICWKLCWFCDTNQSCY